MKIAAAYIRVSDERQDEYSPDSQLKKIREYASKEGCLIPDEYVFYDDGISAKSAKRRKEFNRMVAMAKEKEHPFDVIYVWKFSRFARNQEESMVYKNLLRKKNVAVVSVSEPIPEGHFGTLIERIIEWMDEFYLINLGAEVTRGMTEKASRGEPTCAPPFGYIMKEKKYYPDENGPADVVREIFQRYANGEAEREIAISLGERGVRTKSGKLPENRWIKYILNNPCYAGKIRWSLDGARAVSKRDYSNQNIMTVSGHHEPLISGDLWEKVQKRIEAQKKAYPPYAKKDQPVEYMLKGIVRCSACGATLAMSSITSKSGTRSIQCCNYSRGSCHVSHSVTIPKLEEAFLQALEYSVENQIFNVEPQKPSTPAKDTPDYKKLIALEHRKLERAKAAYLAEIDSLEQYAKNKEDITARINELADQMKNEANGQILDITAYSDKVRKILNYIKQSDVTEKSKNEAVRTVISKIIYFKSTKSVAIYFST